MNDRELLELAAKAAGIEVRWNENWSAFQRATPLQALGGERHAWVPLDDDGDAFRLAVRLCMNIEVTERYVVACSVGNFHESANPDNDAALRRAIVRAAAEIAVAVARDSLAGPQ